MALQKYMSKIQGHKVLSVNSQKVATPEELIVHNLKLVVKIAHDYKYMGVDLADIIQEGNVGLIKASESFDPNKGTFSTYAGICIRKEIREYLDKNCSPVTESHHQKNNISKIYKYIQKFKAEYQYKPTVDHISEYLQMSKVQVRNALRHQVNGKTEITQQVLHNQQHLNLPSDEIEDEDNKKRLKLLMQDLTTQERYILIERFFNKKTLKKLSKDIGVSVMQVKNIQDKALQYLRTFI